MTKESLIKWIHSVEAGKPLRMASIITELYFSRKLTESKFYSDVSEGWLFTKKQVADRSFRNWYRLTVGKDHNEYTFSPVENEFLKRVNTFGHQVFLVFTDSIPPTESDKRLPALKIRVFECIASQGKPSLEETEGAHKEETAINQNLRNYLDKTNVSSDVSFFKWLEAYDTSTLELLFLQRCMMNSLSDLVPVDLDGMGLTREGGELELIEFKRKYPAKGCSMPIKGAHAPSDYCAFAENIRRETNKLDNKRLKENFNSICKMHGFVYKHKQPSYGLDLNHFETLLLCEQMGIKYKYVIWQSDDGKTKRNTDEILAELKKTLSYNGIPIKKPVWRINKLTSSDVTGITYTTGSDSGSYSKDLRVQLTFDAQKFQKGQ